MVLEIPISVNPIGIVEDTNFLDFVNNPKSVAHQNL